MRKTISIDSKQVDAVRKLDKRIEARQGIIKHMAEEIAELKIK